MQEIDITKRKGDIAERGVNGEIYGNKLRHAISRK